MSKTFKMITYDDGKFITTSNDITMSSSVAVTYPTATTATITVTVTGKWHKANSGNSADWWVYSPGASSTVTIDGTSCGRKVVFGNGASDGLSKYWDDTNFTKTFSTTINRTTSSQSISWSATYYSCVDNIDKGSSYTDSGTVSVNALPDYTIRYYHNDGSNNSTVATKYHGRDITLLSTFSRSRTTKEITTTFDSNGGNESYTPVKSTATTTYSFEGWNTSANGGGTSYSGKYTTDSGLTLYAQWTPATTGSSVSLPTPTRAGYTFKVWHSDTTGGDYYTYAPTGSRTLKATWTANNYTVTYDAAGGTVSGSNGKSVTYDSKYGPLPTATRRGYTFYEWTLNGVRVTSENTVSTASDHTLTAKWTANRCKVYFADSEGSFDEYNNGKIPYIIDYDNNSDYDEDTYKPTKVGYNFIGWTTNSDGTDDEHNWSNKLLSKWEWISGEYGIKSEDNDYALYLYPMWSAASIIIRYNLYGNPVYTASIPILSVNEMLSVEEALADATLKHHHKALGWYTASGEKITDFNTHILQYADKVGGIAYDVCDVYAKVEPRFKLLYIDTNGKIWRLTPAIGGNKVCIDIGKGEVEPLFDTNGKQIYDQQGKAIYVISNTSDD